MTRPELSQETIDAVKNVKSRQAEQVNIAWHNDEIISITGNENRVNQIKKLLGIGDKNGN